MLSFQLPSGQEGEARLHIKTIPMRKFKTHQLFQRKRGALMAFTRRKELYLIQEKLPQRCETMPDNNHLCTRIKKPV